MRDELGDFILHTLYQKDGRASNIGKDEGGGMGDEISNFVPDLSSLKLYNCID
jgi:hypothetical protein